MGPAELSFLMAGFLASELESSDWSLIMALYMDYSMSDTTLPRMFPHYYTEYLFHEVCGIEAILQDKMPKYLK